MDLDFISKIYLIIKYFFSSFLGIEMFCVGVILFLFLLFNIKKKSLVIKMGISILLGLILLFISGGFADYVVDSVNSFIKYIMNYYYFPSLAFYYIMTVVATGILIYTLINERMYVVKRIINYVFLSIYFTLFIGVMSYIISNKVELTLDYSIYKDDVILSFIQISNFIFLLFLIITLFYKLYQYFKRKFD